MALWSPKSGSTQANSHGIAIKILKGGASLLVGALVLGSAVWFLQDRANAEQTGVRTTVVSLGNIEKTISALGSVKPKNSVDVGAQVSGQLKSVSVEIGDRVETGQILAEIDPTVYRTKVEADRAKLVDLQAQLEQQRATARLSSLQSQRIERLFKANAISQDALDSAQTSAAVDAARIKSIQAQIDQAKSTLAGDEANLGYARIYAPMSGIVVSQNVLEGQTINANQSAPTILTIADLDTMTVWSDVAEADIGRLEVGMPAYFTTLGDPNRRWKGTVRQILPTPEVVNDVVLYNVLIDVANEDMKLMSEMTAQVFFVQGHAENVPIVSLSTLTATKKPGVWQATVLNGAEKEVRNVKTGLVTRTEAEILSGLTLGDQVVIGTTTRNKAQAGSAPPPVPGMGMGKARL